MPVEKAVRTWNATRRCATCGFVTTAKSLWEATEAMRDHEQYARHTAGLKQ